MLAHSSTPSVDVAALERKVKVVDPRMCVKRVSWDDVERTGGSCWGDNITDTRLRLRDGSPGADNLVVRALCALPPFAQHVCVSVQMVRPQNWNEDIVRATVEDLILIAGEDAAAPRPMRLYDVLRDTRRYAAKRGQALPDGYNPDMTGTGGAAEPLSVRYQVVFIPTGSDEPVEFTPEVYSYGSTAAAPKNLLLFSNPQGTGMAWNTAGRQRLYLHHAGNRHYVSAAPSRFKVGEMQMQSASERAECEAKGLATAVRLGLEGDGPRLGRLVTVQVPLEQPASGMCGFGGSGGGGAFGGGSGFSGGGLLECAAVSEDESIFRCAVAASAAAPTGTGPLRESARLETVAAHVSVGSLGVKGLPSGPSRGSGRPNPCARATSQHPTSTIIDFYLLPPGTQPSDMDVAAALEDMRRQLAAAGGARKLFDTPEFLTGGASGGGGAEDSDTVTLPVAVADPMALPPRARDVTMASGM